MNVGETWAWFASTPGYVGPSVPKSPARTPATLDDLVALPDVRTSIEIEPLVDRLDGALW